MSDRNRIFYNIQDVFFGHSDGEQHEVAGYQILKRINRIQSFNYDIATNREDVSAIGRSQNISRPAIEPPEVNIDFSYILDGVNNENRMGLSVHNDYSLYDHNIPAHLPLVSGYYDHSRNSDRRNVYLIVDKANNDTHGSYTGYPNYVLNTDNISTLADPKASGYGVLAFQNCYLTSYSVDVSVGSLPEASVSMIADNVNFYASGSGIKVPSINAADGTVEYGTDDIVIPKHFREDDVNLSTSLVSFQPGNITASITKETDQGILFHTDVIEACNVKLNLNRDNVSYIGNKVYSDRPVVPPSTVGMDLSFTVKETLSGSFLDDLKRDEDYNVRVSFKTKEGKEGLGYTLAYAKIQDVSYSSQIGSNKTARLSLVSDVDIDSIKRGLFISGQLLSVTAELYEEGSSVGGGSKDIYEVIDGVDTDLGFATFPNY